MPQIVFKKSKKAFLSLYITRNSSGTLLRTVIKKLTVLRTNGLIIVSFLQSQTIKKHAENYV
jgi:hypothetical protein